ncbi:MAG: hypothetical protein R6U38_14575 [Desulfatiglandaceae bacterium]
MSGPSFLTVRRRLSGAGHNHAQPGCGAGVEHAGSAGLREKLARMMGLNRAGAF